MRNWSRRKMDDDDMLIVHPPLEKDHGGREGEDAPELTTVPATERAELQRRLASATNPTERQTVIRLIQTRLGNAAADAIIRDTRDRIDSPPSSAADAAPDPESAAPEPGEEKDEER